MKRKLLSLMVGLVVLLSLAIPAVAAPTGFIAGTVAGTNKSGYDSFVGTEITANNSIVDFGCFSLVADNNTLNAWYVNVIDDINIVGTLEVAYKIGSKYYIVTFDIDGPGKYWIADSKGNNGANSVKVGEYRSRYKLSPQEQALVDAIAAGTISWEDAYQQAEQFRLEAVEKAREEISKLADQSPSTHRLDTVYLGTNRSFSSAGWGVYWSGYSPDYCESLVVLSGNNAYATTTFGPLGLGSAAANAWVGNQFTVAGSGSRVANISVAGSYIGDLFATAVGGSSAGVEIYLVVKDDTAGTSFSTQITSRSEGFGISRIPLTSFNRGLSVLLQAGHDYSAYISIEASASLYGAGMAGSQWGTPSIGDYSKYVKFTSISITF